MKLYVPSSDIFPVIIPVDEFNEQFAGRLFEVNDKLVKYDLEKIP